MTSEEFGQLAAAIGPLDETIDSVIEVSPTEFSVIFSEAEIEVDLDHDEAGGKIVASAEIGTPSPERALAIYEFLLTYAAAWRETGGLGVALTGPGGTLLLTAIIATAGLDARPLATIVTNMARRAVILHGIIAAGVAASSPGPVSPSAIPESLLRV